MRLRKELLLCGLPLLLSPLIHRPALAARAELDVSIAARPSPAARAALENVRSRAAFLRMGRVASVDERYDVPSFLWASRPTGLAAPPARASGPAGAEAAARDHLARFAASYRLGAATQPTSQSVGLAQRRTLWFHSPAWAIA